LCDDLADHWWKRAQLDRLDADVKLRELERAEVEDYRREEQRESLALDATSSEVAKGGFVRQRDSTGKFDLILNALKDLLRRAERGRLSLDDQVLWRALYGTSDRNWCGHNRFAAIEDGDPIDYKRITAFLKRELDSIPTPGPRLATWPSTTFRWWPSGKRGW
jgi:hypothetical protein